MTRRSLCVCAAALVLAALDNTTAVRAEYTFGSFEDLMFVSQWFPSNYNVTQATGQIHNGPTPDNGTGPNGGQPPNSYPKKPGGHFSNYGNWDRSNVDGPIDNLNVNTGWGDWQYNNINASIPATFGLSTTGATNGNKAIKVVPAVFGTNNYSQHLSYRLQLQQANGLGSTAGMAAKRQADFDAFQTHRYFAFDVTYNSADWVGSTDGFVQLTTYYSQTSDSLLYSIFKNLGAFVENTADPNVALLRVPTYDTGNPGNPGFWDPATFPGVHTRTMYWDLNSWERENFEQPGVPSGQFWDFHQFTQDPNVVTPHGGWLEFMVASEYSEAYTSGALYFDNWRFVNQIPSDPGDLDDNGVVDDHDIDILWNVIRPELPGSDDPGADDDEDLNADGFVNEDDVDYMLANLLTAGLNRPYGDADLDGGVGGLDYTAWRLRAGTGWANGDFDGDGGVGGLDYTLWRTRPTQYPTTVGPHSGSGPQVVPEPASLVLLSIGVPILAHIARRRRVKRLDRYLSCRQRTEAVSVPSVRSS